VLPRLAAAKVIIAIRGRNPEHGKPSIQVWERPVAEQQVQRRLSAILVADVVG